LPFRGFTTSLAKGGVFAEQANAPPSVRLPPVGSLLTIFTCSDALVDDLAPQNGAVGRLARWTAYSTNLRGTTLGAHASGANAQHVATVAQGALAPGGVRDGDIGSAAGRQRV